jgi:hypothetical protein
LLAATHRDNRQGVDIVVADADTCAFLAARVDAGGYAGITCRSPPTADVTINGVQYTIVGTASSLHMSPVKKSKDC